MTIRAQFMLDAATPLRRVRIRYNKSSTNPKNIDTFTDEDGFATINRRDRRRGVNVQVYAQTPVATMVTGVRNQPFFVRGRVVDGDTFMVPTQNDRNFFVLTESARQAYNTVFRHFEPFGTEFPFGNDDPNARQRIRIVFPDNTPGNASFCNPSGIAKFPTIHIDRANAFVPGTTTLDVTGVNTVHDVIVSEMAHAIHFGSLSAQRRRAVKRRYLMSLLGEAARDLVAGDPVGRWDENDEVSRIMAFVEAFDLFGGAFHAAPGATVNARIANFFTDPGAAAAVLGAVTSLGPNVPGAVFATIFVDYASAPGIGLREALEQYFDSGALTYPAFRRRIRRRFGDNSAQALALDAAGATWGM